MFYGTIYYITGGSISLALPSSLQLRIMSYVLVMGPMWFSVGDRGNEELKKWKWNGNEPHIRWGHVTYSCFFLFCYPKTFQVWLVPYDHLLVRCGVLNVLGKFQWEIFRSKMALRLERICEGWGSIGKFIFVRYEKVQRYAQPDEYWVFLSFSLSFFHSFIHSFIHFLPHPLEGVKWIKTSATKFY